MFAIDIRTQNVYMYTQTHSFMHTFLVLFHPKVFCMSVAQVYLCSDDRWFFSEMNGKGLMEIVVS